MRLEQIDGFHFRARFDKPHYSELDMDEPAPLGRDSAPNPARILAAAVGDCLSASLLFCMRKAHVDVLGIEAEVDVEIVRTESMRLRIGSMAVRLMPKLAAYSDAQKRCIDMFEDYCIVTQSVRAGVDVRVEVEPRVDADEG